MPKIINIKTLEMQLLHSTTSYKGEDVIGIKLRQCLMNLNYDLINDFCQLYTTNNCEHFGLHIH